MRRLRRNRIAAWLGVLAVVLYASLPGHFAGHIASTALAALEGIHGEHPPQHRAHHPAGHDEHHGGGTCPICAAAAASVAPAAAMLPILATLAAPRSIAAPAAIDEENAAVPAASLSPYAPRGPPPPA